MPVPRFIPLFEDDSKNRDNYRSLLLENNIIYPITNIENVVIYFPHKTSYLKTFLSDEEIKRADIIYGRLIKKQLLVLIQPVQEYFMKELLMDGYFENCFLSVFKDDWDKLDDYFKQDYKVLNNNEVLQSFLN